MRICEELGNAPDKAMQAMLKATNDTYYSFGDEHNFALSHCQDRTCDAIKNTLHREDQRDILEYTTKQHKSEI